MNPGSGPVSLPMVGGWRVKIHRATPYSIHGDGYYELVVERPEEPGRLLSVRTSAHAVEAGVVVGGEATIQFLMGQVTSVKPIGGP